MAMSARKCRALNDLGNDSRNPSHDYRIALSVAVTKSEHYAALLRNLGAVAAGVIGSVWIGLRLGLEHGEHVL